MYREVSNISRILSEPFFSLYNQVETPIAIAFVLGLIGALAPCQLTGNMSAITFYGNRSLQVSRYWGDVIFFIFGKIAVFSGLGFFVWLVGQNFDQYIIFIFPFFRKMIGPFLILLGFFLLGFIKLNIINKLSNLIPLKLKSGKTGSFLLGASFTIAFCPTMFVLFFVTLMPVVLTSSYGMFLPAVFGVGTSIPLLVIIGMVSYLGFSGALLRKSWQVGRWIQIAAGMVLVLMGMLDIVTYWF